VQEGIAMAKTAAAGSWWGLAACQSADPELFFPISGAALADIERAKALCASCAICRQCLDYALRTHQRHGVWGGTTEDERRVIAASRRHDFVLRSG
jgi:WhiB family transcriptional regulator, redox-sensing transcriptional regulator